MRKNEERTRQLQTVKVDAAEVRRALSKQGVPLSRASREMGYADDYLSNRLKEDGSVPVVVQQLLKYKYGVGAEQRQEEIQGQLSLEDIERGRRIEEKARKDREKMETAAATVSPEAHAQHVRDFYEFVHHKYGEINGDTARGLLKTGVAEAYTTILMQDLGLIREGGRK